MISKQKFYEFDGLEELEEDLQDLKCLFNEKIFMKTKKKEKKFKNKPCYE